MSHNGKAIVATLPRKLFGENKISAAQTIIHSRCCDKALMSVCHEEEGEKKTNLFHVKQIKDARRAHKIKIWDKHCNTDVFTCAQHAGSASSGTRNCICGTKSSSCNTRELSFDVVWN